MTESASRFPDTDICRACHTRKPIADLISIDDEHECGWQCRNGCDDGMGIHPCRDRPTPRKCRIGDHCTIYLATVLS